jgi:hypothetical protein
MLAEDVEAAMVALGSMAFGRAGVRPYGEHEYQQA